MGFWTNQLDYRGTGRNVYAMAQAVETVLCMHTVIFTYADAMTHCRADCTAESERWFKDRFRVVEVQRNNASDFVARVDGEGVVVLLLCISGLGDRVCGSQFADKLLASTAVHAIFSARWWWPLRGCKRATVMRISTAVPGWPVPVLPNAVLGPDPALGDLRQQLGIPVGDNVVVLCRHGGYDTWDTEYNTYIDQALTLSPGLYFVFMGTRAWLPMHPRKIFLPSASGETVWRFINTCDAMVYGRQQGETFGLSIAEFSLASKPIILHPGRHMTEGFHRQTLANGRAITFTAWAQFVDIAVHFRERYGREGSTWAQAQYEPYRAEQVVRQLYDLVIHTALRDSALPLHQEPFSSPTVERAGGRFGSSLHLLFALLGFAVVIRVACMEGLRVGRTSPPQYGNPGFPVLPRSVARTGGSRNHNTDIGNIRHPFVSFFCFPVCP